MSSLRRIAIIILFALMSSCVSTLKYYMADEEIKEFFEMSVDEQERHFGDYTLDEQYELYIFGNQVIHPPMMHERTFAKQGGPGIIELLRNKLDNANDDATVRDIVLYFMN